MPRDYVASVPMPAERITWRRAASWRKVIGSVSAGRRHHQISDDFRRIAEANGTVTARARQRFGA